MKSRWYLGLATGLMIVAPLAAQAPARDCPGFPGGQASRNDADQFYAARAAEILRAARRGDRETLAAMVAPGFNFTVKQADLFLAGSKDGG